jgi:hypothetical protein
MQISFNASRVINKPRDNEAIADTGTTDHFLKEGAPCDEKKLPPSQSKLKCQTDQWRKAHTRATSEYQAYPKN